MKSRPMLAGLLLLTLACQREREAGIYVRVLFEPGVVSTHVLVSATAGDVRRSTACMKVDPAGLDVAVAQADLPAVITLSAEGFADDACATPTDPPETAVPLERRFHQGLILQAELRVRPTRPRIETQCQNGLDDDGDGARDCLDDDCVDRECSTGNACVMGQRCQNRACVGGAQVTCETAPSSCFMAPGLCVTDAGCRYLPTPGVSCVDSNDCTENDRCDSSGACSGTPRTCATPPAGQCWQAQGSCVPGAGCTYQPDLGAGCDDGENCTVGDACTGDAGCAGTRVTCTPGMCQRFTDTCLADGGCVFAPIDAGTPCGAGGACNLYGGCLPPLPFAPSNVAPLEIPTPPATKVTLDCGTTVIDTGTSGAPTVTNWCAGQPPFGWAAITQPGGLAAVVLAFDDLDLAGPATLELVGSRPAIIISTGDVRVLGTLIVTAGAQACAGAGAGAAGASGVLNNSGGGGGGFGSPGGAGARVTAGNLGGAGGTVAGNDTLTPLRGGCPGGRGGGSGERAASGGGALQLSAAGEVVLAGTIHAPGQGGRGGGAFNGGNGGGSGGAVLIEAQRFIASAGGVYANGGGGGEAGTGNDGQDGRASAVPATGGTDGLLGGAGGSGAAGATAAEDGVQSAGGGGGGVGRLRINVTELCNIGTPVTLSPAATSNKADAGCP